MTYCEIGGYFSVKQCEKIKEKLQGKTFLNFDIQYGGYGEQNQIISVGSEIDDCSPEELKNLFIHYCLAELAKS